MPRELLKESCGWGKPHRSTKFASEERQQSLQAEVCTKLPESSEKFRTSPEAQQSQVTEGQGRKDITGTKRRVSTCSDSTRTHRHHRGTDREQLPRCCHQCGKAMLFILLQEGVLESFHYFRLAHYAQILHHLIQYYSQDYAQLTGVIRATPPAKIQQHHGAQNHSRKYFQVFSWHERGRSSKILGNKKSTQMWCAENSTKIAAPTDRLLILDLQQGWVKNTSTN